MDFVNLSKVIVKNKSGKLLVIRSSEWPERPDRSLKPDLPGGVVDPGENHFDGALRELEEEIGLRVKKDELKVIYAHSEFKRNERINRLIFLIEAPDDIEIKLSWEHDKFWWAGAREFLELQWRDPYPDIFNYLRSIGFFESS